MASVGLIKDRKYYPVPVCSNKPLPPAVPPGGAEGAAQHKAKVEASRTQFDFFAKILGCTKGPGIDGFYMIVSFLDPIIWKHYRRTMAEMNKDYLAHHEERRVTLETFKELIKQQGKQFERKEAKEEDTGEQTVEGHVVALEYFGGDPTFVRCRVDFVSTQDAVPELNLTGWDDNRSRRVTIDNVFAMTEKAAGYRCMAVPLVFHGVHSFFDSTEMFDAFDKIWKTEVDQVVAGKVFKDQPRTQAHALLNKKTYVFETFYGMNLNQMVVVEYTQLMKLEPSWQTNFRLTVTHIDEYSHVWFQYAHDPHVRRLNGICEEGSTLVSPLSQGFGMIPTKENFGKVVYAAKGKVDGKYRRVICKEFNGDQLRVEFIDYGYEESCKLDDMYDLARHDKLSAMLGPRCIMGLLYGKWIGLTMNNHTLGGVRKQLKSLHKHTLVGEYIEEKTDPLTNNNLYVYEIRGEKRGGGSSEERPVIEDLWGNKIDPQKQRPPVDRPRCYDSAQEDPNIRIFPFGEDWWK